MNSDLQKIRKSRFFRRLPDRAFERIVSLIKVRAYEAGEEVFNTEKPNEFQNSYGFVVTGAVLFVNENSAPLGLVLRDEFFLTRKFTLSDEYIHRLIAIDPKTFVVYLPRDIILLLAQASTMADIIEEIYSSIFERAEAIRRDVNGGHEVQSWLKFDRYDKILSLWVEGIEKKRQLTIKEKDKAKSGERKAKLIHGILFAICSLSIVWSRLYLLHHPQKHLSALALYVTQTAFLFMVIVIVTEILDLVFDRNPKKIISDNIKIESLEEELSKIHSSIPFQKPKVKEKLISYLSSNKFRKIIFIIFYGFSGLQFILTMLTFF